jgi:hypothetical protein
MNHGNLPHALRKIGDTISAPIDPADQMRERGAGDRQQAEGTGPGATSPVVLTIP